MTWTYSGDPASSDRDEVRFLVGDTDTNDQLVTDEEIAYAVANEGNNYLAAAEICRAIAAKFAKLVDKSVGDLRIAYNQRQQAYKDLMKMLTTRGNRSAATPYAGGISISDKDTVEDNTDRVQPGIKRNLHDHVPRKEVDEYD